MKVANESKKLRDNEFINQECNRLFFAANETQEILADTYITHGSSRAGNGKASGFHLTASDLERSDMGCIKFLLIRFMKSCFIDVLVENNMRFPDNSDDIESLDNKIPPEIPVRSKVEKIGNDVIQFICK
jgi:hypothetical protein